MKWQIPFNSADSWREPRRTQIPAVTDLSPGICSDKTVMPLASLVEWTLSIMLRCTKKELKPKVPFKELELAS